MFGDAERALFNHLAAMPGVSMTDSDDTWTLVAPGADYTPKANRAYIETEWMQPSRVRSSFGRGRTSHMRGLYQISLKYPADKKAQGAIIDMADALANHFYPTHRLGQILTFGSTVVEIHDLPEPGPLLRGQVHNHKPLTVTYWFDDNPA